MNTESCDCRRCPDPFEGEVKPGDFCWGADEEGDTRYLYIVLPSDNRPTAIKVHRGAPGGNRIWGWDGNEDKPTLAPSIDWSGRWHGHLVAGRLVSC
jgi:hypothetical protein